VTAQTRRRIWIALVAIALTLPTESILLKAGSTLDQQQAAQSWVAGLSQAQLDSAAWQVEAYPFTYRREIMRALDPADRSAVWRNHIQSYLDANPGLPADAIPVLEAVMAAATPEALSAPTADTRAQIDALAEQVQALLGRDQAEYLLYRLGPADTAVAATALPVSQRLADWLRGKFVALAFPTQCNCSLDWGCTEGTYCADGTGCWPDDEWPMCGWLWNEECDGYCKAGFAG
jgi:hypothetical protein